MLHFCSQPGAYLFDDVDQFSTYSFLLTYKTPSHSHNNGTLTTLVSAQNVACRCGTFSPQIRRSLIYSVLCVIGQQNEDQCFTWDNSICTSPEQTSYKFQWGRIVMWWILIPDSMNSGNKSVKCHYCTNRLTSNIWV